MCVTSAKYPSRICTQVLIAYGTSIQILILSRCPPSSSTSRSAGKSASSSKTMVNRLPFWKIKGLEWKYVEFIVDVALLPLEWFGDAYVYLPLSVLQALFRKLCMNIDIGCHLMNTLDGVNAKSIAAYIMHLVRSCGCTGHNQEEFALRLYF
ncbi:uncharacterized protein LOC125025842 isoform X1 [Penaeus chinensis]|uniref:uncharacterized protein LOC125025842 isoform X1 n=1 Tax=Penaeus chinensis TaxID=139456 RepID=UPI001FB83C60|nr:uncharacterized protein LOC125025842 isoform X1 [Penaeus chinensis]